MRQDTDIDPRRAARPGGDTPPDLANQPWAPDQVEPPRLRRTATCPALAVSYQATHHWRDRWREYVPDYRQEPELLALSWLLVDYTSALVDYTSADEEDSARFGLAWPTVATLAEALGVKRDTVIELLRELARRGVIEILPGAAPRTGSRGRPGNAYRYLRGPDPVWWTR